MGLAGFRPRVVSDEVGASVAVIRLGDVAAFRLVGSRSGSCVSVDRDLISARPLLNVPADKTMKVADLDADGLRTVVSGSGLTVAMQNGDSLRFARR